MRAIIVLVGVSAFLGAATTHASETSGAPVSIETDHLRIAVDAQARVIAFTDIASSKDYLGESPGPAVARITQSGRTIEAASVVYDDNRLRVIFGEDDARAVIHVGIHRNHLTLEVESLTGENVDELTFLDVPLALAGNLEEPFAACALALNLQTRVPEIPGPNARLRAMCYPRFGFAGARVAVIGAPQAALRDIMKEVVAAAPELPQSRIGGPWALDAEISRGSYLFDFGHCTEETVDDWIALVKTLGLKQIDFHTGTSLRFGDYEPNPELFPRGRASVKAVIDKLHDAGIAAGLHTYAFFIAKNAKYVTPVPDPRLGRSATFTLAADLTADAAEVKVEERTSDVSTITGFFVRNSVTLQIGDELITFSGAAKDPPYGFTGCVRGAHGTTAAAHAKGAQVRHLKECFGLFTPDADSTLLAEVAANTADTFNECGFDMIYLDALDGEDILAGGEYGWHYGSKFVFEIANRLHKPALFEMSTFHHHLWYVRARMGAWDHPNRSHKRFIDVHCAENDAGRRMFLPMNLGWWAVKTWTGPRAEPTFPDDIEYLMGKALGWDWSIALMGVNPSNLPTVPAYQRLAPIFRQYEELRLARHFPEPVRAALREPGAEFTLEQDESGAWAFRRMQYARHRVRGVDGWSNFWTIENAFDEQPLQLRIEALMVAGPYDAPENSVLADFAEPDGFGPIVAQDGVQAALSVSEDDERHGATCGVFTAMNAGRPPNGAWARADMTFEPHLNLDKHRALGVWVHGDGSGALLNLQLRSPGHLAHGFGDHYVLLDFSGWRYFDLIEHEGARISDYVWPYGGAYGIYREDIHHGHIEGLSLWLNNVPEGGEARCMMRPIKALPVVPCVLRRPRVRIGDQTVVFPVEIETGAYLEFRSMTNCKLYAPDGELRAEITPEGQHPVLRSGQNAIAFECDSPESGARAHVTVITRGERIR